MGEPGAVGVAQPVNQLWAPQPFRVIPLRAHKNDVVAVRGWFGGNVALFVEHAGRQIMALDVGVVVEPISHLFVDRKKVVDVPIWAGRDVALAFQPHPQIQVVGD